MLALFLRNCDENFDRSLFWRPKSGKQLCRECWMDTKTWHKESLTKNDEVWNWAEFIHPTYLPFDILTPWICETLVGKYYDKSVERPEWMRSKEAEGKFIKRVSEIYEWYGEDGENVNEAWLEVWLKVNEALDLLFDKSCENLKRVDGQLTFTKSKKMISALSKTLKIGTERRREGGKEGKGPKTKITPAIN